jgi:hypothetical protein
MVFMNHQILPIGTDIIEMLLVILFSDLAKNQLTGEIPRLIYWNEVLQYL